MKNTFRSIKSVFVTGLLIVFPAWLAILLFVKMLVHLEVIVQPFAAGLPEQISHPVPWAAVAFLLICFAIGLLFHTAIGKLLGRNIEQAVLNRIPGYSSLRGIARQVSDTETKDGFKPALIEVEDGCFTPAFLIEGNDQGFSTIFVPSVPTPMAGSILLMPTARVHPIDVPVATMMKCISKWGTGAQEILSHLKAEPSPEKDDPQIPSTSP